ncbi:3' terminal RNA ribose 2'-O-methyltransferase Hen1 [Hymenobacter sp. HSC-4F20]|uniref:3' terminal RNA ribose 2'-O-methyltransferase Hen1 n=1 Tax=Hymenobacter sp. HSC-4F20 TaxID=2864135 RepID=UPI001C73910F|nr:3' terminal RNA ribose 2'-O-methyltransferase Hen1 [Hymenobacter sp. HSC-4F20]MBX0289384.1 3' terminal RNA ribose 2'-O-methyltransferase Hen1 [Hymenobacter sp. HSC-4F20]
MLLTISTTHQPATDLGYLLHKNPARLQTVAVAAGQAHIFYPEATAERCTVALLLDIDPVALVRSHRGPAGEGFALEQYVNDRPYVASSFFSVALGKAFNTALNGTCKERPDLPEQRLPLAATVAVMPAASAEQLRRLFEPLGYEVEVEAHPLDPTVPEWGNSRYFTLRLQHPAVRLQELLSHLYVLIPVLDRGDKHYWVAQAEAEKLLRRGAAWLPQHPEREFITRRYLRFAEYVNPTLERLLAAEQAATDDVAADAREEIALAETAAILTSGGSVVPAAEKQNLHDLRLDRVAEELRRLGAQRVLDLGCGEGKLVRRLLKLPQVEHILALDVSWRELERAQQRLNIAEMPPRQRERLTLTQGSLLYHDPRLAGYDAAAVVEVIEHLDESRLAAFEQVVFARARPGAVLVTTPNAEYNQRYEALSAGEFRHEDHRFEWTQAQFAEWAAGVAERNGYRVRIEPLGPEVAEHGAPSQLAVFER